MSKQKSTKGRKKGPGVQGRKVRIAMIGAGGMANGVHYPSLAAFEDVEFAGISDIDEERLTTTADKYNIKKRFTSYPELLEKTKPDGVYVVGQPNIMYDIWMVCLNQGLNLYIEKPMGLTIHQARSLAHVAEKQGVITQVSHQRRSCPLLRKLHAKCLKRGPIHYATCEFYKHGPAPWLGPRDHMMDDFTHTVDTVRWMCGGEVLDVISQCRRIGTPDINWIAATLLFDNGSTGYAVSNWCSGRRVLRVQMHAPGISVDAEVEGKARLYADDDYEGVEYDTRKVAGSDDSRVFGGFEAKNREFIDSIKTGKEITSSPFRDCVKTMEVCEVILAQALLDGE